MSAHILNGDRALRARPVNLRDLGGIPTRRGTVIRPERLFRSDDLSVVQPREVISILHAVGLVVDLRSVEEERLYGVARLPDQTERLRASIEFGSLPSAADLADDATTLPRTAEELGSMYADGIRGNASALGHALERIAEQPRGTLVHCVAGKDRTGVLVALLLTALEVPRSLIVEDYAATAANMPALLSSAGGLLNLTGQGDRRTSGEGPDDPVHPDLSSLMDMLPSVLLDAPAAAMQACLDDLDDSHGSPLGPLREAGLDASVETALRSSLVKDG